MKIKILQENLIKALSQTGRIISAKAQLPVLQNVLLATDSNLLRITTANLENAMSTLVGVKIEKPGAACVPSKLFTELAVSLPQETVELEEKNSSLAVSTSRTHAVLPGMPVGEFPPVQLGGKNIGLGLDKAVFKDVLTEVLFAAATDEGRPLLTGVKIVQKDGFLTLAATDGYRLSVKTLGKAAKGEIDMVVPARALSEASKIIAEAKEDVIIAVEKTDDGQLVFAVGDTRITTRLIDGEYPNYEKIIPKTHTTSLRVDSAVFLSAVKSASIFARDNANIVKLHVEKNKSFVSANTPQVGENTVEIDSAVDGDGGDIAFNSRFLLEFLNNFPDAELVFEMTGSLNPGVFRSPKDESFLHIIMPVRVQA